MTKETSVTLGNKPNNSVPEEQGLKVENLHKAILEGEESGAPTDFDMVTFIKGRVKSSKTNGTG